MNPTCYEAPVLADYLAGRAAATLAQQVESHLRTCRRCQQALVQSSPPVDSLLEAVRATRSVERAEKEPELVMALGVIGNLHSGSTPGGRSEQSSADTGRLISNYELQKKLGEGGMGAVYLARHLRLKKSVAIKLLKGERSLDDSAIARFQVEIEAVGKLEHPHIVRALDAGEDRGTHFLVMEYLAGIDAARLVRGLGPLGMPEACELVRQAALGLHHAHENEVIHRDVKPSNLMLLAGGKVKVLDLGLAHFRSDWGQSHGLTRADQVLGTLLYVAPEQLAPGGKVDARTDVYSLGVTLAEILLGLVPCRSGQAVLIGDEERAARPDVPPDIWQLIARMTALDPQARPGSMLTVAETLRPWCAGANLGRLLERLAGQTTFADPAFAAAGPVTLAHGRQSPSRAYDPEFVDVVPPPIAGVMEVRGYTTTAAPYPSLDLRPDEQPAADLQRAGQKVDFLASRLAWLASGSVLALVAALAIWGLSQGAATVNPSPSDGATNPDDGLPPASTTGTVEVKSDDPIYAGLVQTILKDSALLAEPLGGGEPVTLRPGPNALAAGQYKLRRAPNQQRPAAQQNWKIEQYFIVEAGVTAEIMPFLEFSMPPSTMLRIPEPGHRVTYSGSLTPRLPGTAAATAVSRPVAADAAVAAGAPVAENDAVQTKQFKLAISTLFDELVNATPHRWLKLELTDTAESYSETAYLLLDMNEYEQHHRLVIDQGWIEATSNQIETALARALPDAPPSSLVAEFDTAFDRLGEPARRIRRILASDRIGIHAALVLLFDVDCQAAPEWMRTIQASSLEPVRYASATMNSNGKLRPGLVIESEKMHSAASHQQSLMTRLQIKRSEEVPFSLVSLKFDSPELAADLYVLSHTELGQPTTIPPIPLERLTTTSQRILDLPLDDDPLDVVTLPADGEGVRFRGGLTAPAILFNAQVRMLGTEVVDGRRFRWLEVDVTSIPAGGNSHRERAVILFDEPRFERHGELEIVRGWFETGEHWLPLTTDTPRPMETIAADLKVLGAPLPALRLGVHDVLALLSKTALQSMFGDVRDKFAHLRALYNRDPEWEPDEKFNHFGTADRTVVADVYTLTLPNETASYEIVRSQELPFDIVKVRITTDPGMTLTAEVGDVIAADANEPADLARHAATWEFHRDAHLKRVESARSKQNPAPNKAGTKQRQTTAPRR